MKHGIWDMGLLSTVVSRPVFNLEYFRSDLFTKFKITQNPKQGVKNYPGLTPLIFTTRPAKMPQQYYKLALPIEQHHQT